jgi:hypothetical protein
MAAARGKWQTQSKKISLRLNAGHMLNWELIIHTRKKEGAVL